MRILSLSAVYPNPLQPGLGPFVRQRLRQIATHCEVVVVAPVPYFPVGRALAGRPSGVPASRRDGEIDVFHPRFWSPPGIGKCLDGMLYAASIGGLVRRLHRDRKFDLIDAHFAYPDGFGLSGRFLPAFVWHASSTCR